MKVQIPTPLRSYTADQPTVEVGGATVGEALTNLIAVYAGLRRQLFTDDGRLRAFVNLYLNDQDIRYLQKEHTSVGDADVLYIVPSVAGGVTARS
jgi:molybdopterin converting factor small subunit